MTISETKGPTQVNTDRSFDAPAVAAPAAEPAAVLPAPDYVSGDPIAMLAKLFVKSAQQKRDSNNLSAKIAEQVEDAADARRIEATKDKADQTFNASMVAGLSQVGSGACSIVGGARSASALNAPAPAPEQPGATAPADLRAASAQSTSATWDGAANATGGLGKLGEATIRRSADSADQDIAKAESESKVAKRAQDALHKEVDAATQHEGKVIQLLQEIKQAQQQCEHAALLRA